MKSWLSGLLLYPAPLLVAPSMMAPSLTALSLVALRASIVSLSRKLHTCLKCCPRVCVCARKGVCLCVSISASDSDTQIRACEGCGQQQTDGTHKPASAALYHSPRIKLLSELRLCCTCMPLFGRVRTCLHVRRHARAC